MKYLVFLFVVFSAANAWSDDCKQDAREELKSTIALEIAASKSCVSNADCKIVYFGCPFGCSTAINASNEDKLKQLTESYREQSCAQCMYKCAAPGMAQCVDSVCTEVDADS